MWNFAPIYHGSYSHGIKGTNDSKMLGFLFLILISKPTPELSSTRAIFLDCMQDILPPHPIQPYRVISYSIVKKSCDS